MNKKKNKTRRIISTILKISVFAIIAVILATAAINIYMINSTEDDIISLKESEEFAPDCIIVLGAYVYSDGRPSQVLKERLDSAISLYESGVSDKILMSGDNGQNEYNEVVPMRQYAIDQGIPEEDIYLDYAGFSTYESMYRLRDIFEVDKAVVVTQRYHMYRALYIGEALDIDVKGYTAEDRPSGQKSRKIREIFARVKSFGLLMVNAKPTYLGGTVSLDEPQQLEE